MILLKTFYVNILFLLLRFQNNIILYSFISLFYFWILLPYYFSVKDFPFILYKIWWKISIYGKKGIQSRFIWNILQILEKHYSRESIIWITHFSRKNDNKRISNIDDIFKYHQNLVIFFHFLFLLQRTYASVSM